MHDQRIERWQSRSRTSVVESLHESRHEFRFTALVKQLRLRKARRREYLRVIDGLPSVLGAVFDHEVDRRLDLLLTELASCNHGS